MHFSIFDKRYLPQRIVGRHVVFQLRLAVPQDSANGQHAPTYSNMVKVVNALKKIDPTVNIEIRFAAR
jgi:hypothetical protein